MHLLSSCPDLCVGHWKSIFQTCSFWGWISTYDFANKGIPCAQKNCVMDSQNVGYEPYDLITSDRPCFHGQKGWLPKSRFPTESDPQLMYSFHQDRYFAIRNGKPFPTISTRVNIRKAIEKGPVEIVDLPIKNDESFQLFIVGILGCLIPCWMKEPSKP
jgi:hypothetical protein